MTLPKELPTASTRRGSFSGLRLGRLAARSDGVENRRGPILPAWLIA